MEALLATHPPLEARIRRIDPKWDGRYKSVAAPIRAGGEAAPAAPAPPAAFPVGEASGAIMAAHLLAGRGRPGPAQVEYAAALIDEMPPSLREMAHEPYGARALIYGLVINRQPAMQQKQMAQLEAFGDTGIHALVGQALAAVQALPVRLRLPLIDMALPSLRQLSNAQYRIFKQNLQFLVKADNRIDVFEWALQKIMFHHLDPQFGASPKPGRASRTLKAVRAQINILMSLLVHACVRDKSQIGAALVAAETHLGLHGLTLLPAPEVTLTALDRALDDLAATKPAFRRHLLQACLALVTLDKEYSPDEMELMRAIGAVLDCPLPPFRHAPKQTPGAP